MCTIIKLCIKQNKSLCYYTCMHVIEILLHLFPSNRTYIYVHKFRGDYKFLEMIKRKPSIAILPLNLIGHSMHMLEVYPLCSIYQLKFTILAFHIIMYVHTYILYKQFCACICIGK